jgi:hypothetical protein
MRIAWGFAAEEKDAVFPKPFRIDIHPPGGYNRSIRTKLWNQTL